MTHSHLIVRSHVRKFSVIKRKTLKRQARISVCILVLLFVSCDSTTTFPEEQRSRKQAKHKTKEPAKSPYREIDTPAQEHGYRNFDTTVLRTREELNQSMLAKHIGPAGGWNKLDEFRNALDRAAIDFDEETLMLIRNDASYRNGDVQFAPRVEKNQLIINVKREQQGAVGASVMQYFAYAVAANTEHLHTVRIEIDGKEQRTLWIK